MIVKAAGAALAGILGLAAAAGTAHAERLTVAQYGILVITLPFAVATENGYWKDEGLDVDGIIQSAGGGTSVRNMMASDLPISEMALSTAISASAEGMKLRIVADDANTIGEVSWATKKDSGIHTVEDLAGKKVAFSSPRSITETTLKTILERHGVLDKVETIATGGLGAGLTALNQGAVDAAPIVDPMLTTKGGNYNIFIAGAKELPDLSWSALVTTDEFMAKHEDQVRKVVRARARAVDFIYDHPAETEKIYAKYWNVSADEAKAMLPKFYAIRIWKRGAFNMKGFATMIEGMQLVGAVDKGYDIKPLLDYRFQDELKEKTN